MLADLPAPDRVFIGGSGGRMKDIIGHVLSRMEAGIVVVNAATFETLDEALGAFRAAGLEPDVSQISVSRMKPVGTRHLFAAQNPIFVVRARKG
jgi:precorrin-6Y C5,15-methyltransferase (decarboxylating)